MEDMTDKAIGSIGQQKALMPDRPFFIYFAPGATHAPHHVPKEWADKYRGKFDAGWDTLREEIFTRQKTLGVIPSDCQLTARHKEIPAWDAMPEELKPVLRRQMEMYAGFLEFTDHHVGRLLDTLKKLSILDDTLVFYIIGDNGASAEGTLNGTYNEMINFNGAAALETPAIRRFFFFVLFLDSYVLLAAPVGSRSGGLWGTSAVLPPDACWRHRSCPDAIPPGPECQWPRYCLAMPSEQTPAGQPHHAGCPGSGWSS